MLLTVLDGQLEKPLRQDVVVALKDARGGTQALGDGAEHGGLVV
jgi:hypothetical protein